MRPVIAGTIAAVPHLFSVSSPFRLGPLRELLKSHPNRPLVDSILHGFEYGFWPGHSGDFSAASQPVPPPELADEDHDFIADRLDKDFEKGYLSEPFDRLYPGMVISPGFVVRLENRKPRGVVNQTASGLNAGISREDARVVYDTIAELARLIRYRHQRGELEDDSLLFKSDVEGAFRNVPMHRHWQIKQVHRARVWDPRRRRFAFRYYVDQRLVFGGRYSPKLWCTIINVVLYCTKVTLELEYPLIYVDDLFGTDVSGIKVEITHPQTGETRLVPRDQGRVLAVWSFVGVPWSWEKQISGRVIIILGHLVDLDSLTVSLPPEAKVAFLTFIDEFLADKDAAPPLVRWQRLAGYGQWVCTSLPFARFALNPIYAKMKGKAKRMAKIRLNVEVRRSLEWLGKEIRTAPPLFLLDPALEDWSSDRSADLVVYTDACLISDGGHGSGLGFWLREQGSPHRRGFFSRISPPLPPGEIFLGEALAIASAISIVLDRRYVRRRLLLFTDSALSVYAFDSGRAEGNISELVLGAYEQLRAAGIDLRVRHVAGDLNTTADRLSPFRPRSVSHLLQHAIAGGGRTMSRSKAGATARIRPSVAFSSSPSRFTPPRLPPNPPLSSLAARALELVDHAKEKSTVRGYRSSLRRHWLPFLRLYNLKDEPSAWNLLLFVPWAGARLRGVDKILSAVRWWYLVSDRAWEKARRHPLVVAALDGLKKENPHEIQRAPPLLPHHILTLVRHALRPGTSYADLLGAVLVVVGFGGLHRLGELVLPDKRDDRDERKLIKRQSVKVFAGGFSFRLPFSKTDKLWHGAQVTILSENSIDGVNFPSLFAAFLRRRDLLYPSSPFFFASAPGGLPPRRSFVVNRLRAVDPALGGHSLRAGGATFLASLGVRPDVIQRLGRWASDTWHIYLRNNPAVAAAVQRVELAGRA
ncbi:hypothetical protein JCM8097_006449 [Rhodosporidiobolus ruineniae]